MSESVAKFGEQRLSNFGIVLRSLPEAAEDSLPVRIVSGEGLFNGLVVDLVDTVGGAGIERRAAAGTEARGVAKWRRTGRALGERRTADAGPFVGRDVMMVPDTPHHLVVRRLIVSFEDVRVRRDADHEPDSVVADALVAHPRNRSVSEGVGIDLFPWDVRPLGDVLESVTGLRARDGIPNFPRNGPAVLPRAFAALRRAEQRCVLVVGMFGVGVEPSGDVRPGPQQRSRTAGPLQAHGVVVQTDGARALCQLDVLQPDAQSSRDALAGDDEKGDERGVARVATGIQKRIHLVGHEDVPGADGRGVRSADLDVLGPLAVEFVAEEELGRLAVLAERAVGEAVVGNVVVVTMSHPGQDVQQVVLSHLDERDVRPLGQLLCAVEAALESVRGDILRARPTEDGVGVGFVVEFADAVQLGLHPRLEVRRVVDVARHVMSATGAVIIKLSAGVLPQIWRRLWGLLRIAVTVADDSSPTSADACISSGSSGGVAA